MNDSILSRCFPETRSYSKDDLLNFINRYKTVFIKPDLSGQGRGILLVNKETQGGYHILGCSLQGKSVDEHIATIEDLHNFIQPYTKFQRILPYVIQEGIQSTTPSGLSSGIRVHEMDCRRNAWKTFSRQ